MNLRARRRADPPARLTSQLNRERGRTGSCAGRSQERSGQLVSRWTTNEAGRLVMAWSLEPLVEVAPAIRLSARPPGPGAVALRRHWSAADGAGGGSA